MSAVLTAMLAGLLPVAAVGAESAAEPPGPVEIALTGSGPDPAYTTAEPGRTVVWTNATGAGSSVTGDAGLLDSGSVPDGGAYAAALDQHGAYRYDTPAGQGWLVVGDKALDGPDTDPAALHVPDAAFPERPTGDLSLHPDLLVDASRSRVIAGFTETATVAEANAAITAAGGTIIGGIADLRTVLLTVPPGGDFTAVTAAVDALRADPAVAYAIHDLPDEPASVPPASSTTLQDAGYRWDVPTLAAHGELGDGANWHLEASQFPAAWNLRETIDQTSPTARTLVADTGFVADHPDLDIDIVELCQDTLLWGDCTTSNAAEHGMHVAGIVGADHDDPDTEPDDTGAGVTGGNPAADVVGVAVIGPPLVTLEDFSLILDAIEDGSLGDVRIINYSGGSPMPDEATWTQDAVERGPVCGPGSHDDGPDGGTVDANGNAGRWCTPEVDDGHRQEIENGAVPFDMLARRAADADVMVVTSAGNASLDYCVPADQPGNCTYEPQSAEYNSELGWLAANWDADPARAAWPNPILTVGAVGASGGGGVAAGPARSRMGFSNIGEDVSAPGIMLSTYPGGYGGEGGTSQASPLVAALAGYLLAYQPDLTLDELRAAIVDWAWADTTDGAAPRIGAFRSLLSLDGVARALVDVNDPSADGNRRVVLGPGGANAGTDTVRSSRPGETTDADGTIDMRDFRRFRDAWLARCVLEHETGCPTGTAVTLDGPPDHVKFDANLDGCVSTTTSAGGTDPTCPTSEVAWPRFDFNGDGEVSRTATALVPLRPDGTPADGPTQATAMTDLEVLASQFDGDSTGAWATADLVDLMVSGDITIHADPFFADGADRVTVTAERPDGTSLGLVRLTDPAAPGVLTVPDGDTILSATATYPDTSTVDATAEQVTVTPGSDHRVDLCRLGDLSLSADDAALDADGTDATTIRATLTTCGGTDPLHGVDVDVTVTPSGTGHATVAPGTITTDAAGQATTTLTAGTEGARYTVTATATLPDGSTTSATVGVAVGGLNVAYVWQMVPTGYTETGSTRWPDPIDPAQPDCTIEGVVDHCIDDYTQTLDGTADGYRRDGTLTGGPDRFLVTETVSGAGAGTRTTWTQSDPDGTDLHAGEAVTSVQVESDERSKYAGHDLGAATTAEELDGAVVLHGLDAVGGLGYHHEQTTTTQSYDPPADPRFPTVLPPPPVEIRSSSSGLLLDPTNPDRAFRYADQAGAPLVFPADGPDAFSPVSSCVTLDTSTAMERGYLVQEGYEWADSGSSHLRDPDYDAGDLPMPVGTSDLTVTYAFTAVAYRGGTAPAISLPDCATLTGPTASFDATPVDPGASTAVDFTDTSTDPDGTIAARLWDFGDGTTSTEAAPTHDYAAGGTYDVTLTVVDDDGATASTTQQVLVLPPVTFTVDPAAPEEGRVVTFTDTTGMAGADRTWDLGDGTATGEVATHLYGDDGTYPVTLTLTADGGQTVSATRTVTVANVAPTGDVDDLTVEESTPTSLTVRLYDPGEADQAALDWQLSSSNPAFGPALTGTGGDRGIEHASLPGLPTGTYPLTLTVTDKDGGTSTTTATLTVVAAGDLPPPPPPGEPVPTCDPTVELDPVEAEQLDLVNDYRADNGLDPVIASPALTTAADRHAVDLAANELLSHTGTDGSTPRSRADDAGYPWAIGENAAHIPDSGAAADVMAGWRSSWEHNANILDPDWTVLGIARAEATSGDWYWVNVFGDTDDCDTGSASTNSAVSGMSVRTLAAPGPATVGTTSAETNPGTAAAAFVVSDTTPDATTTVTVTNRSRAGDGTPVAATLHHGDGTSQPIGPGGSLTVTAQAAGTQTVTVTSQETTVSAAVALHVGDAPNRAPFAHAGGDPDFGYGVQRGEGVALDATASTDPDGDATIVAYDWDLDGDGDHDDASGEAVTVDWTTIETLVCAGTCTEGGSHPIRLRVTDDGGATDTASTTLTVWGEPDFRLALSPTSQPINQGETADFLVRVDPVNGFDDGVRLSVPDLPEGWRADLATTYARPPQVVNLAITAPDDAAEGGVDIVVQGTGGGITHTSDGTAEVVFGLIPECTVTISGTVTDAETGDPIDQVVIEGSLFTDSNGFYSFEHIADRSLYSIKAEHPDYWTGSEPLGHSTVCGNDETIDIELVRVRTGSMHGRVTEGVKDAFGAVVSTGVPLDGISVSAGTAGSQRTGTDGVWDYDDVAINPGNRDYAYRVRATDPDDEFWPNDQRVVVSADQDTAAPDLPLLRKCNGVVGGGTVVDADGNPVADTLVEYWRGSRWRSADGSIRTDANGQFSFDVEELLATNNDRQRISFLAHPHDDWYHESRAGSGSEFMDGCGGRTPDIELVVTEVEEPPPYRNVTVEGTVTDSATGLPVRNAKARMTVTYPAEWPPTEKMTSRGSPTYWLADDGRYSIELQAGRSEDEHVDRDVTVTVSAPGYHADQVVGVATTGITETIEVALDPILYGSVSGTIRDIATGEPIEGADVHVAGHRLLHDRTGPDGTYRVDQVPMDQGETVRTVSVSAERDYYTYDPIYYQEERHDVVVNAGELTSGIDLDLLPPCPTATVTGVVVDATTMDPIEDARVRGWGSEYTDADGRFAFTDIDLGHRNSSVTRTLTADADGYLSASKTITISCGSQVFIEFGTPTGGYGAIVGTVTDDTGTPLEDVQIASEFGGADTTDTNGDYRIDNAPLHSDGTDRTWNVTALTDNGLTTRSADVTVTADTDVRQDFTFGGNAPPTAAGQTVSTDQGSPVAVTLSGDDPDGDPLTYAVVDGPDHGTLAGTAPALTYTPDPGWSGTDRFTFTTHDGTDTSPAATVTVDVAAVNAPPTAHDQVVTTDRDTPVEVMLTGDDPDGDPLTYAVVDGPDHGTLAGTAPALTYTPEPGWSGTDTFTFNADDGTDTSATATVTLTVEDPDAGGTPPTTDPPPPPLPTNEPPTARDQTVTTDQDTPVAVRLVGDDPDGDPLTYTVVADPAHGTLTGAAPELIFTPRAGWSGTDSFTFAADDGQATSATATVTVTVTATSADRIGGADRIGTSVDLSVATFDRADAAVLARADLFPDALAASSLAAEVDAPILLTARDRLDGAVADELRRLGVDTVHLVGGSQALTAQVAADTAALGMDVERVGGADRYHTAALIARHIVELGGPVDSAVVALGHRTDGRDAWPDALSASTLVAAARAPMLLVTPDTVPDATRIALEDLLDEGSRVWITGGTRAVGAAPAENMRDAGYDVVLVAGADRYATAVQVAQIAARHGTSFDLVLLASGATFADALSAGAVAAHTGTTLLLTDPHDLAEGRTTLAFLEGKPVRDIVVIGGPHAVSADVADRAHDTITPDARPGGQGTDIPAGGRGR